MDGQTIVAYGPDWPAALRKLQEIVSQHHAFPPPSGQTAFQIAHRMDMLERRLSNLEGLVSPSAWHQGRGS